MRLNSSANLSYWFISFSLDCSPYGGVGDISGESVRKEEMEDVVKEEEEGEEKGGGTDSVLLFDEQTNSFQLYNEEQNKVLILLFRYSATFMSHSCKS